MLRISAVSYLNALPFVYGLEHSRFLDAFQLEFDVPAACAEKLLHDHVDIGLVPVAILRDLKVKYLLTDYCIGSYGSVGSVLLLSHKPLDQVKNIYLDVESRTSIRLTKILAKYFWQVDVVWHRFYHEAYLANEQPEAIVVIGNKAFELRTQYEYVYDLSSEWYKFTSLPFVFACWVANKSLPAVLLDQFNQAIYYGIAHKLNSIEHVEHPLLSKEALQDYIENKIDYYFDADKRQALELFLGFEV